MRRRLSGTRLVPGPGFALKIESAQAGATSISPDDTIDRQDPRKIPITAFFEPVHERRGTGVMKFRPGMLPEYLI
jgi:hypothetical protein